MARVDCTVRFDAIGFARPLWESAVPVGFPTQRTVGVPEGTVLTAYVGPSTITTDGTTITDKTITGGLVIDAEDVTLRRCHISGTTGGGGTLVDTGNDPAAARSLLIEDCEIVQAEGSDTALGEVNITVRRSNLHGGRRVCHLFGNVTIEDSILWGVDEAAPGDHQSVARFGQDSNLIRCTLIGDPFSVFDSTPPRDDGNLSAAVTGYGDFLTIQNCNLTNCFIEWVRASYAVYGGYNVSKAFPNGNAMEYTNNIHGIYPGASTRSGYVGTYTDWPYDLTSNNYFLNNKFTSGADAAAGL